MIRVKIAATTSNIGPGFDCLGIALDLYNEFRIDIAERLTISGCPEQYCNEDNLVYRAYTHTINRLKKKSRPIAIQFANAIPISRGLGSSASCILAGVIAANEFGGANLSKEQLLKIALELEHHPDNLAPALYGGMVLSITTQSKTVCQTIKIRDDLAFVAIVPDYQLSTEKSRAVLPKSLSYSQTVYNVGRCALLISALENGDYHLLRHACDDAIHQPFRKHLIPQYDEIETLAYSCGAYAFYLSGAGSTMIAICNANDHKFHNIIQKLPANWQCHILKTVPTGAVVEKV